MPEILAIYDTDTDSLEMEDQYFNWYDARDDWDEEINKVIQEIINSPVVWYCLIHGDCHITDRLLRLRILVLPPLHTPVLTEISVFVNKLQLVMEIKLFRM